MTEERAYTRTGKQVMRRGEHFADAVDEAAAAHIVTALNKAAHMADHKVMGWEGLDA